MKADTGQLQDPEAERYQRHGNEYRIALVFHGEQGPLCIYPGRDDHLQGA